MTCPLAGLPRRVTTLAVVIVHHNASTAVQISSTAQRGYCGRSASDAPSPGMQHEEREAAARLGPLSALHEAISSLSCAVTSATEAWQEVQPAVVAACVALPAPGPPPGDVDPGAAAAQQRSPTAGPPAAGRSHSSTALSSLRQTFAVQDAGAETSGWAADHCRLQASQPQTSVTRCLVEDVCVGGVARTRRLAHRGPAGAVTAAPKDSGSAAGFASGHDVRSFLDPTVCLPNGVCNETRIVRQRLASHAWMQVRWQGLPPEAREPHPRVRGCLGTNVFESPSGARGSARAALASNPAIGCRGPSLLQQLQAPVDRTEQARSKHAAWTTGDCQEGKAATCVNAQTDVADAESGALAAEAVGRSAAAAACELGLVGEQVRSAPFRRDCA